MTDSHGERIARLETRTETMDFVVREINESLKKLSDAVTRMESIQTVLERHDAEIRGLDGEINEFNEKIETIGRKVYEADQFVRSRWWASVAVVSSVVVVIQLIISLAR